MSEGRVELRRFLGGVPFSHVRKITPIERKALVMEVLPYVLIILLLLGLAIWGSAVTSSLGLAGALVTLVVLFIGYGANWMWPHVQTLRTGQIYVYIGRMNDLTAFDVVQEHYRGKQRVIAEHMDRYIEILATGKGDRLWRLEGVTNHGALKGVRSRWLALVPDQDENGRRPLTPEEGKELRLRARDFVAIGPFVGKQLFSIFAAIQGAQFLRIILPGIPPLPALYGLLVVMTLCVWGPYIKRLWFARTLMKDARAGVVEDGLLISGMPWVIEGEPARWRVGTSRGSTNGVTITQAWRLETLAHPKDDDDLEENDEELASPAKA